MQNLKINNNFNFFILNFNKIFINSKNINSNYFFLINYFSLINDINFFSFFIKKNFLIFSNLNNFYLKNKKNYNRFFKINNKNRHFLYFYKYLIKNKFKYNKLFNYFYLSNLLLKKKIKNTQFTYLYNFNRLKYSFFHIYFKFFYKNWNFLLGYSISPFWWDLYSKKKWVRNKINYSLHNNRYFFSKTSKNFSKKRNRNRVLSKNSIYSRKYIVNKFFYLKKFDKKFQNTSLKYVLKLNPNFRLFKKKNYDWFLSKPYLFLNTYKNFKLNKHYSNYLFIFFYKKYFRFFNILKRVNFNTKFRKTNNFFFIKNFFNIDLKSKSYRNRYFKIYNNLKKKFPLFKFNHFFINNLRKKNLKKKLIYFWFLKLLYNGKTLKKNKFIFNYKTFLNKKILFIKSSRRLKKRNIFIKSFKTLKRNLNYKLFSLKFKKFKSKFKFKYKSKLKYNKFFLKNNFRIKNKFIIRFKIKFRKLPLKFFFIKLNKKNLYKNLYFLNKNKSSLFFKWKILNFSKFNKLKKNKIFNKTKTLSYFKTLKNSNILKKLKKPFFFTKTKTSFSLKLYGFLFLNNNLFNFLNNSELNYSIKKTLYSFSYKNEIQRFILKKYIKNNYLIDSTSKNNIFSNHINLSELSNKNTYLNYFNKFFKSDSFSYFNFFDSFSQKNNLIQLILNKNITYFDNWNYYENSLAYFKNTFKENSDFTIKRVRFKPGYMSLWRDVRNILKTSLSLNFRYQYKLTNYLARYKKFINFKTFLFLEMRLINILIKSRLFNDLNLALIFINYNLIFVNGIFCNNQNLQIFVGDFIQVVINLKYYILTRWFLNLNLKKKNKLKSVFKKKNSSSSYSDEKKKSYNMPQWILSNKNLFDDCVNYLEVDFFTLSTFVVYEPFLWSDINPYNLLEQKFSIINLYNWKYIT